MNKAQNRDPDVTAYIAARALVGTILKNPNNYPLVDDMYVDKRHGGEISKWEIDFISAMIDVAHKKYPEIAREFDDKYDNKENSYFVRRAIYERNDIATALADNPEAKIIMVAPGMKGVSEYFAAHYPKAEFLNIELPNMKNFRDDAEEYFGYKNPVNITNSAEDLNKVSLHKICVHAGFDVAPDHGKNKDVMVSAMGVLPYMYKTNVTNFFGDFKHFPEGTRLLFNVVNDPKRTAASNIYKSIYSTKEVKELLTSKNIDLHETIVDGNRSIYVATYTGKKEEKGNDLPGLEIIGQRIKSVISGLNPEKATAGIPSL